MCLALPGKGYNRSISQGALSGGIYNLVSMITATFTSQMQSRVIVLALKSLWALKQSSDTLMVILKNSFGKVKIRKGTGFT